MSVLSFSAASGTPSTHFFSCISLVLIHLIVETFSSAYVFGSRFGPRGKSSVYKRRMCFEYVCVSFHILDILFLVCISASGRSFGLVHEEERVQTESVSSAPVSSFPGPCWGQARSLSR